MIAITPEGMFTGAQFKAFRDTVQRNLQGNVRGSTNANLVTRPLLPTDLYGAETADFTNTSAIAAANVAVPQASIVAVPQAKAYAIFGFAALVAAPKIVEMWLGNGGSRFAQVRLSPIYAQGSARPRVGYFDPVYFLANDNVVVTFVADAAVLVNAEVFELIGLVGETQSNIAVQSAIAPGQAPNQVDG